MKVKILFISLLLFVQSNALFAQQNGVLVGTAQAAMMRATKYMVDSVSIHGGYDRVYLSDLSRRWGELEAYKTQIWMTYGLTPDMGNTFLNAFDVTGNEYYYRAAEKVANAIIWGQLPCGGWNYIIDFAGDRSLKEWYKTIGINAWGWDEYNHYYGNATFKNATTTKAAQFLLRLYLEKLDPQFKPALDKAIDFIIKSQYPLGGWPQRAPQKIKAQFRFGVGENPAYFDHYTDYTSDYIFNDDLTWENIKFLIECYITLGEERFLDHIQRGMNFYLLAQQGNPQGGWAQQYDMDLKPAHGRQYEPASLSPGDTYRICELLMKFYKYTGDRKYLSRIPDAIQWLKSCCLPGSENENGTCTNPVFVEIGSNKAIYAHRKGTGVNHGHYWVDYSDSNPLLHYGAKETLNFKQLEDEYKKIDALSPEEATRNSPLAVGKFNGNQTPQSFFKTDPKQWHYNDNSYPEANIETIPNDSEVREIISSLDSKNRWLSKHEWISHPYSVSKTGEESNTALLSTEGGAQIKDSSNQEYISTLVYMKNMNLLINYLKK
ncbi:MAG: pectate lyase [Chitinophagaceae bacterium]|nr:MAG: pectate lyase [Chitinophagaceae bacterium]